MTDGRNFTSTRIVPAIAGLLAIVLSFLGLMAVVPAHAEPTIDSVKEKVERLEHEAEIASENYNTAKVRKEAAEKQLKALRFDARTQSAKVSQLRSDVAALVVSQYQGQAFSTATEVALADDPDSFLDNLNAVTAYNSQRAEVLETFGIELERLELREAAVKEESKALAGIAEDMRAHKDEIDEKVAAAKAELDKLEEEELAKLLEQQNAGAPSVDFSNVPVSGRAGAAVKFALSQVGKAYVYGAAGPNAYDCSGLTMAAWGRVGVGLPHSSRAQMGSGRPVSMGSLQPGDLVFYYSPVSHVGMYIGNGQIVHAANPRSGVNVAGVNSMPVSGAVRPG